MAKEMKNEVNDKELREKAKKISIAEGSSYSFMDGFGLRYITPYALALGASNFVIGLLSSLPQLLGNLAQLPIPKLMKKTSRKKIIITAVFLQSFLWLPIILVGFLYFFLHINSVLAANLLIIFYTLMIIAGSIPSPAWNSWMRDIVKERSAEYFGKRSRILGVSLILSMIIAGIILNYFGKDNLMGFIIIFIIAFIGRFGSGYLLKKQYEPEFKFDENYYFSPMEFIKKMPNNNFGRFVILISSVTFATTIASPFFSVYMLKNLGFSYLSFTIITLIAPLATLIFMPSWGKFADKFGNIKVLKTTGFLIPLVPIIWIGTIFLPNSLPTILIYLIIAETFSGFAWAGFTLSSVNFIYDAVTRQRMALCVSYYNIINAGGTFAGAILGGILASQNMILGINSLIFVFILSGILRFFFFIIVSKGIKEVRPVEKIGIRKHIRSELRKYLTFSMDRTNPTQIR